MRYYLSRRLRALTNLERPLTDAERAELERQDWAYYVLGNLSYEDHLRIEHALREDARRRAAPLAPGAAKE